jgi:hypothetical protein
LCKRLSLADQTKLFGAMPDSTKSLGRLAFIPVDIRDLQDGTLAGRTTLGALGTQFLKGIRSGKFMLVVQVGHTDVITEISVDDSGRLDSQGVKKFAQLIRQAGSDAPAPAYGTAALSDESKPVQARGPGQSGVAPQTMAFRVVGYEMPVLGSAECKIISARNLVVEKKREAVFISVRGASKPVLLQFLAANRPAINAILPTGARLGTGRPKSEEEWLKLTIDFQEPFADGLVELRASKQFSALKGTVEATGDNDLVSYSEQHPGAAALVGYALLRAEQHAVVEKALHRIRNLAAMEPDTTILLAECAMRAGKAREALVLFLESTRQGIPSFSIGLSYLTERLRLFAQTNPCGSSWLSAEARANAKSALLHLQAICMFQDYSRVFTTYRGISPAVPGVEPLSEEDLARLLPSSRTVNCK